MSDQNHDAIRFSMFSTLTEKRTAMTNDEDIREMLVEVLQKLSTLEREIETIKQKVNAILSRR